MRTYATFVLFKKVSTHDQVPQISYNLNCFSVVQSAYLLSLEVTRARELQREFEFETSQINIDGLWWFINTGIQVKSLFLYCHRCWSG